MLSFLVYVPTDDRVSVQSQTSYSTTKKPPISFTFGYLSERFWTFFFFFCFSLSLCFCSLCSWLIGERVNVQAEENDFFRWESWWNNSWSSRGGLHQIKLFASFHSMISFFSFLFVLVVVCIVSAWWLWWSWLRRLSSSIFWSRGTRWRDRRCWRWHPLGTGRWTFRRLFFGSPWWIGAGHLPEASYKGLHSLL